MKRGLIVLFIFAILISSVAFVGADSTTAGLKDAWSPDSSMNAVCVPTEDMPCTDSDSCWKCVKVENGKAITIIKRSRAEAAVSCNGRLISEVSCSGDSATSESVKENGPWSVQKPALFTSFTTNWNLMLANFGKGAQAGIAHAAAVRGFEWLGKIFG